jgi:hypothetical protein
MAHGASLYPLPVPTRQIGTIGKTSSRCRRRPLDTTSRVLQMHIDPMTGRVWLVPTWKRPLAKAAIAARNFVASVLRDVGLPDMLVSDGDTRFTSKSEF